MKPAGRLRQVSELNPQFCVQAFSPSLAVHISKYRQDASRLVHKPLVFTATPVGNFAQL